MVQLKMTRQRLKLRVRLTAIDASLRRHKPPMTGAVLLTQMHRQTVYTQEYL